VIREITAGEQLALLDDSLGWAWGYAGQDRRVGYVRSEALSPQ
jgi:dipeptidyl peptidase-like protein